MAPIRDLWENFHPKLSSYYKPGFELTVDEQLVPFRGRCPFKIYNKSKPDKFGMVIYWIVDSNTNYPLRAIPYLGKYYLGRYFSLFSYTYLGKGHMSDGDGLATSLVKSLAKPFYGSSRNITMDNFFTSKPLADFLLTKRITIVGTVRSNKGMVPKEFVSKRNLGTCLYGYQHQHCSITFLSSKTE